ncbi:hypothetical protein [Mycolicibacterium vaccae]|uniref:hypothetical protein n=1 Tax=Mycolicibacterium vaccae TaxID=1810 RepID=UPI003D05D5B6
MTLKQTWRPGEKYTAEAANALAASINRFNALMASLTVNGNLRELMATVVSQFVDENLAAFVPRAIPVTSGPDAGKAQWIDGNGDPVGDPVPWSQVVSEQIVRAAAEAAAPEVVSNRVAGLDFTFDEEGYPTLGGTRTGNPLEFLPSSTWAGVAGKDEGVKRATGGIVPIERFNPDSVGWKAAMEAAATEAHATGGTVHLGAGKTYLATSGAVLIDLDVRIADNGARIVRAASMANTPVLTASYTTSAPQAVVGLTTTTYDWGGQTASATPTTRLELSSTAGWAAGDWAVIVGDDTIPGSDPAWGQREGERVQIAAVSGNYLYLYRPLRVTLTTGIRVARMTVRDCVMSDLWVEDEPGAPASRNAPAVHVVHAVRPRLVNARARNLMGEGYRFTGCVKGSIPGGEFSNLRTSSANSAYGYGVVLMSCNDFDVDNLRGDSQRHVITTGAKQSVTAGSSDLSQFGSNRGHRINVNAGEVGSAGIDTHAEAIDCVCENFTVGWGHREPEGSFKAVNLRGLRNVARNGRSSTIRATEVEAFDGGGDHRIIGHVHSAPDGAVLADPVHHVQYASRSTRGRAEYTRCQDYLPNVSTDAVTKSLFVARKASVRLNDHRMVLNSAQSPLRVFATYDAELLIDTLELDIRGTTGEVRVFYPTDSTSTVRIERLIVRASGATWRIVDFNGQNGALSVGRIETDTAPAGTGTTGVGAAASLSIGDVLVNQQSILTGADFKNNGTGPTGAGGAPGSWAKRQQVLDVPITVARTITEANGLHLGHERVYIRTSAATGAFPWNIGSGGEALTTPGTWVRRMWTGTAWITVGKGTL